MVKWQRMLWEFLDKLFSRTQTGSGTTSARGEQIEQEILRWFEHHYSAGANWQDAKFHCFAGVPLELRMVPACNALEYNLGNGGWPQLLWNCFGTWRELLALCGDGYALIGATNQVAAMTPLHAQLVAYEEECRECMRLADVENDFSYFGKFTTRSFELLCPDWQSCFWNSETFELRHAWLEKNSQLVKELLRAS